MNYDSMSGPSREVYDAHEAYHRAGHMDEVVAYQIQIHNAESIMADGTWAGRPLTDTERYGLGQDVLSAQKQIDRYTRIYRRLPFSGY